MTSKGGKARKETEILLHRRSFIFPARRIEVFVKKRLSRGGSVRRFVLLGLQEWRDRTSTFQMCPLSSWHRYPLGTSLVPSLKKAKYRLCVGDESLRFCRNEGGRSVLFETGWARAARWCIL